MLVRESISFQRYKDPKEALFGWRPGQLIARRTSDITYINIYVGESTAILDDGISHYHFGSIDKYGFEFTKDSFLYGFSPWTDSASQYSNLTTEEKEMINEAIAERKDLIDLAESKTELKIFT